MGSPKDLMNSKHAAWPFMDRLKAPSLSPAKESAPVPDTGWAVTTYEEVVRPNYVGHQTGRCYTNYERVGL